MGTLVLLLIFGVPIVAIITSSMEKREKMRLKAAEGGGSSPRLEALESEVQQLRQDLTETQERLDFAERMLAKNKQPPQLGA